MPEISSFPDFMADWDHLLRSVRKNSQTLPDLEEILEPLVVFLDEARDLHAAKAGARTLLSQGAKRSRAAASRVRAALKAHFGGHNEMLVEYGIAPLRVRRQPQPADPIPPSPPPPVPEPE